RAMPRTDVAFKNESSPAEPRAAALQRTSPVGSLRDAPPTSAPGLRRIAARSRARGKLFCHVAGVAMQSRLERIARPVWPEVPPQRLACRAGGHQDPCGG